MKLFDGLILIAALSAAAPALAQAPACAGHYEVIRTDTIKPGKMELFEKAIHDNQGWYVAHHLPDHIMIGRVLQPRGAVGGPFSETTAMTIHTDAPSASAPPHEGDKTWDAFVAEYRESSDMASQSVVCVSAVK